VAQVGLGSANEDGVGERHPFTIRAIPFDKTVAGKAWQALCEIFHKVPDSPREGRKQKVRSRSEELFAAQMNAAAVTFPASSMFCDRMSAK